MPSQEIGFCELESTFGHQGEEKRGEKKRGEGRQQSRTTWGPAIKCKAGGGGKINRNQERESRREGGWAAWNSQRPQKRDLPPNSPGYYRD